MVLFLLAGCSSQRAETTLTQTAVLPEIWDISITSDLDWLRPILNSCAQAEENVGLIDIPSTLPETQNKPVDFRFLVSDTPSSDNPIFDLGLEYLAVIVHPDNPVTQLTWQEFADIQAGVITNWQDTSSGQSAGFSEPISVFHYMDKSGIQQFLYSKINKTQSANFSVLLAPGPYEMMTGVKMEGGGIGILPERLVDESVIQLMISGIENQDLAVPILVETKTEPKGSALNFLVCLQKQIN